MRILKALLSCAMSLGPLAWAAPMAPPATVTVSGTIQEISWHPARTLKATPGMSGTLGQDRTFRAYYSTTLTGMREETVEHPERGLPYRFNTLELAHPKDDGLLKKSMKIRVIRYTQWGDEGGTRTTFEKLQILDNNGAVVKSIKFGD